MRKRETEKRILVWGLLLLMFNLLGCGKKQEVMPTENGPTVTVVEAKGEELYVNKVYDAVLELSEEQYICSQVSGYLRSFYYNEGEKVEAGDKIAWLENESIYTVQASREQEWQIAQIQYKKAQARAEETEKEIERKRFLYQKGAISQAELNKSELEWHLVSRDCEQAEKQMQLASILLDENNGNIGNCEVLAEDSLCLAEKLVKTGQHINVGQAIFRAGKCDVLLINIMVPADEAAEWQVGDKLDTEHKDEVREAIIQSIGKVARPGTLRVAVQAQVNNPEMDWLPGATVQIKYAKKMGKQIMIPAEAIAQGENPYVYILKDTKVQRQTVELGTVEGSRICVYGIQEGSRVVTSGLHRLRDGEEVNIKAGL